ncbi:efflux RND transporter periplasmic adaptor subunit [Aestuariivirga sp.]|uniref:efflux RND transporter periplasmic adaptor subunit n=1 Tax=Aestuariivirga sp. TaxID=2650926 RepID=UPI0039E43C95
MRSTRRFLLTAVFACSVSVLGPAFADDAPPPTVETAAVRLSDVNTGSQFVGTVQALQKVGLTARVEGFLDSIDFQEGGFVKAGSTAFTIEKDTYQAALDGAQATLQAAQATEAGAQANLRQAEITLQRQLTLFKTNTVSQSQVDQATADRDAAKATVEQAQAQIAQAQAQIKTAQLNLSYTQITTPISGRIGKAQVTVGNLVSPNTGVLATVVQTDPIRVAFSISDRDYLKVVDALKPRDTGFTAGENADYVPHLILPDGTPYKNEGRITFLDNSIDPTTGTIAVYAEFANPELQLVPGQFVTVTVKAANAAPLPVVPAPAVQQDQQGPYVFVLDDANHAVIRRVTLGPRVGTDWAVTSGLANGEIVIVSGIQKIKAGIVVKPVAQGN